MATSSPRCVKKRGTSVAESGREGALKVVRNIVGPAAELYQDDLEHLCKLSLAASKQNAILAKHELMKSNMKHPERKMMEMISSGINVMSEIQIKNHAMRFGSEDSEKGLLQKPFSVFSGAKNSFLNVVGGGSSNNSVDSHDYEDIISDAVLKAPITELCVIQRGEPVPLGFLRISKTPGNKKANLNASSGGNHLYFCIKKDQSKEAVPITALVLIFPDRSEFVPPGYFVARHDKFACNLNSGTSAERIFLCYKKDKSGNPITDLVVIFPGKSEEPPKSFNLIEKSPTDLPANVNTGTVGGRIFICYKQSLIRLECLRNDINLMVSTSISVINGISKDSKNRSSSPPKGHGLGSGALGPVAANPNRTALNTNNTSQKSVGSNGSTAAIVTTSPLSPSTRKNVLDGSVAKLLNPSNSRQTTESSSGISQEEIVAVGQGDFSDDEGGETVFIMNSIFMISI